MPFFKSKPKLVEKDNEVSFRLDCKYIGSQALNVTKAADQQRFVNEKLSEIEGTVRGVSVVLVISTTGLKTYDRSGTTVKLAHAISRISSSTCNPENKLFAYVARTRQSTGVVNLQAHIYRTKKTSQAQQLGTFTVRAFRLALSKATFVRDSLAKSFDEEVDSTKPLDKTAQAVRRRWAKHELAKGHDYSEHASRARVSSGALVYNEWKERFPSNSSEQSDDHINDIEKTSPSSQSEVENGDNGVPYEVFSGTDTEIAVAATNAEQEESARHDGVPARPLHTTSIPLPANAPLLDSQPETVRPEMQEVMFTKPSGVTSPPSAAAGVDEHDSDGTEDDRSRKISDIVPEAELLHASEWFQEGLTRELCEEALSDALVGSFLVRRSQSTYGYYGMTVCCQGPPNVVLKNFLITRAGDGQLQIQGCRASFGTLTGLVSHYASTNEDLPVRLRLSMGNPLFAEGSDHSPDCNANAHGLGTAAAILEDDEYDPDYEHFCSSEGIMRELSKTMTI